jgi:hypothetical protein
VIGTRNVRMAVKAVALTGAAILIVPLLGAPAHALRGSPVTLVGAVSCDPTTGHQLVAWTLTNPSGSSITIDSADIDGSGMTAGAPIDQTATLTPNPVAFNGSATGITAVSGDGTGDLHLLVAYTFADSDPTIDGEVVLPGGCVKVAPTTTTTATSTTTRAVQAAVVAARPAFTG